MKWKDVEKEAKRWVYEQLPKHINITYEVKKDPHQDIALITMKPTFIDEFQAHMREWLKEKGYEI